MALEGSPKANRGHLDKQLSVTQNENAQGRRRGQWSVVGFFLVAVKSY